MFINIGFESVNKALKTEINNIYNEKNKLKVSYLQRSSINSLSGTASRFQMVHINDKNSFTINENNYKFSNKLNEKTLNEKLQAYQLERKKLIYGF